MSKVSWSTEDTLVYHDIFDENIRYEFENDERKLHQFQKWMEFRESDYYDMTPPPDFVTKTEEEEEIEEEE